LGFMEKMRRMVGEGFCVWVWVWGWSFYLEVYEGLGLSQFWTDMKMRLMRLRNFMPIHLYNRVSN
jgi:hypothetical protein